jgi:hypothetical protein
MPTDESDGTTTITEREAVIRPSSTMVHGRRSEKGFRRCQIQRFPRAIETYLRDHSSLISPPFGRMEVPKAA